MNLSITEHIAEAARLLDNAKEIARRPKETSEDRKRDENIVLDLLSFSTAHSHIANAMATAEIAVRTGR